MTPLLDFFDVVVFLLSTNISTSSGVITIFMYDGFDQKSKNREKNPSEFCPISEKENQQGGGIPPLHTHTHTHTHTPTHTHTHTRLELIENVILCEE